MTVVLLPVPRRGFLARLAGAVRSGFDRLRAALGGQSFDDVVIAGFRSFLVAAGFRLLGAALLP